MIVREGNPAIDTRHHRKLVAKIFLHGRLIWSRAQGDYLYYAPMTMWLTQSNGNKDTGEVLSNVQWNIK